MPYTGTGRWFPAEWFEEMGVAPVYPDISEEDIVAAQLERAAIVMEREAIAQRERLRLEMEAEEARLAALAARPPLIERIRQQFENSLFTASSRPVYRCDILPPIENENQFDVPQYRAVPGYQQILNERSDQIMSIMTSDYEIINDIDVCRRTAELFDAAHLNVDPLHHHVSVGKDGIIGRSTYMEYNLPDMTVMPNEDLHEMRIIVTNSFDGTKKERLLLLLKSATTNNYSLGFSQHEQFAIKHRTGANARLVEQFGNFVNNSIAHNAACITLLRNQAAPTADVVAEYLNTNPILTGERNAEKLMGRWMVNGTTLNLWNIYQIFTHIITQEYGRNFGAKLGKMEQLNLQVRRIWPGMFHMEQLPQI